MQQGWCCLLRIWVGEGYLDKARCLKDSNIAMPAYVARERQE